MNLRMAQAVAIRSTWIPWRVTKCMAASLISKSRDLRRLGGPPSEILGRYRDLGIGLADASIVVLAERYGVLEVLTLDHRHFQALRGPGGRRFRLRPVV